MNSKWNFVADQVSGEFLKAWAVTTFGVDSDVEDDLFMFCAFDNI